MKIILYNESHFFNVSDAWMGFLAALPESTSIVIDGTSVNAQANQAKFIRELVNAANRSAHDRVQLTVHAESKSEPQTEAKTVVAQPKKKRSPHHGRRKHFSNSPSGPTTKKLEAESAKAYGRKLAEIRQSHRIDQIALSRAICQDGGKPCQGNISKVENGTIPVTKFFSDRMVLGLRALGASPTEIKSLQDFWDKP